jgi:hypothetical protein
MPDLHMKIEEELAQGLERYAFSSGQDVTDVATEALEQYLKGTGNISA